MQEEQYTSSQHGEPISTFPDQFTLTSTSNLKTGINGHHHPLFFNNPHTLEKENLHNYTSLVTTDGIYDVQSWAVVLSHLTPQLLFVN